MRYNAERLTAAVLITGTALTASSASSESKIPRHSSRISTLGSETLRSESNPHVPQTTAMQLGRTATATSEATSTSTPTPSESPSSTSPRTLPAITDLPPIPMKTMPLSPQQRREQQANEQYVTTRLVPEITKKGWKIVKPIHTNVDPVNQPGQFMVSLDASDCVMQFSVHPSETKGKYNIMFNALGEKALLADGRYYSRALIRGPHTEGNLIYGHDFSNPQEAVGYIKQLRSHGNGQGIKAVYDQLCS